MKDLIAFVAVSVAIGFALGGLQASGPPVAAPEPPAPPIPPPGVYTVSEHSPDAGPDPYIWTLSACGPRCLRVLEPARDATWHLDLVWNAGADRNRGGWVGERVNPGVRCHPGLPDQHITGPVAFKYVLKPDLTGFVNMKFSQGNPSCSGETVMRGHELTLRPARAVWS